MIAWKNNEIMSLSLILMVGVGYGFVSLEMFGKPIEPRITIHAATSWYRNI